MARIYADEDFNLRVVEELRRLGHDVLTVHEAGRGGQGIDDADVLAYAITLGRAVLTFDRRDYHRLAGLTPAHAGIITCTRDTNVAALAHRIHVAVTAMGDLTNQVVRVVKPHKP